MSESEDTMRFSWIADALNMGCRLARFFAATLMQPVFALILCIETHGVLK
jgi:hypothetical protein